MSEGKEKAVDCGEAARRLFGYLDGELTAEQVGEIEAHLAECGSCAEADAAERKLIAAIKATAASSSDLALRARVLAAIRRSAVTEADK
jgi:anti-sigma factor (TIGR02949 family)